MRIPSGSTDRKVSFIAVDASGNYVTGLSSFTVYRMRDGGTPTVYTTPTIAEASAANMPGVYTLLIDEDSSVAAGHDVEELILRITAAGMQPVTLAHELERVKFTEGQSVVVANSCVDADLERVTGNAVPATSSNGVPKVDVSHLGGVAQSLTDLKDFADTGYDPATHKVETVKVVDTLTTYTGNTPQTGDAFARLGAPAGASVSADVAAVKSDSAAIKAKTDNLPLDPADASDIAASFAATPAAVWAAGTRTLTSSLDPTAAQIRAEIDTNSTKLDAAVSTRATPAQVNAEVVDALNVDTYAEPGQGAPAATLSLVAKIGYLFKNWRNRRTQSATEQRLYADDATTVDQKRAVSDAAGTTETAEVASGP